MGNILNKTFAATDMVNLFGHATSPLVYFKYKRNDGIICTYGDIYLYTNKVYTEDPIQVESYQPTTGPYVYEKVIARADATAANLYSASIMPSAGTVLLSKKAANTYTTLFTYTLPIQQWHKKYKLKLKVSGVANPVNLKVYLDDVLVIDFDETTSIYTLGKCGSRFLYSSDYQEYLKIYNGAGAIIDEWNFLTAENRFFYEGATANLVSYDAGTDMIYNDNATTTQREIYQFPLIKQESMEVSCRFMLGASPGQALLGIGYHLVHSYRLSVIAATIYIYKRVLSGSWVLLASAAISPALSATEKYYMKLKKDGTTLKAYLDVGAGYVEKLSVVDTAVKDGWPWWWFYSNTKMQNFLAESVDTTPPTAPTEVAARWTPNANIISWTNPTDTDLTKIVIEGSTDGTTYTEITSWDTLYGDTLATSYKDTAIKNKFYRLKAIDNGNNASSYSTVVQAKNPTLVKKISGRIYKDIDQKTDAIEVQSRIFI